MTVNYPTTPAATPYFTGVKADDFQGPADALTVTVDGKSVSLTEALAATPAGSVVPVTVNTAPGATVALAFAASGDICYDVTLAVATTFTISGGAGNQLQKLTLLVRQPAAGGIVGTLPAQSSSLKYKSGTVPSIGTAVGDVTVVTYITTDGKIVLGGI